MTEYIKRSDAMRIVRRAFDFDYDEETAIEALPPEDVVDKKLLDEIRENLDYFIDYYDKHVEPTDYAAGRKSAFEDIARMIDNYQKAEEPER